MFDSDIDNVTGNPGILIRSNTEFELNLQSKIRKKTQQTELEILMKKREPKKV